MSEVRPPATVFTRQQMGEWMSAPELAMWPSSVTIDGLMRQAGAALVAQPSTDADTDALALGQALLDSLSTASSTEIRTAVITLMVAVRDR